MIKVNNSSSEPTLISAEVLMRSIGLLALFLPFLLVSVSVFLQNCDWLQNSISAYYHTISRNLFVGALCAISFCLFAYQGYGKLDNYLANGAAVLALGVAFFPTSVGQPFSTCIPSSIDSGIYNLFHFLSAAGLFIILALFCLLLFTQSKGEMSKAKLKRNALYKSCGIIILASISLIGIYQSAFQDLDVLVQLRPVYWLETIALWAFSISWLCKSGSFLKD